MDRIPAHTIDDAPDASRPLLASFAASSPTGAPLRFQAQMAHAPAVLASYASLRRAIQELRTLAPRDRAAIMAAASSAFDLEYVRAVTARIGLGAGWSPDLVTRLQAGTGSGDPKLDALLAVVVSAARTTGKVEDAVWRQARDSGWSDAQLAEWPG